MAKTIAIGIQDFGSLIQNDYFYIDKTHFIKEWWENGDTVTLITRPRRFGKTLTMSMLEHFFSINHAGHGELFENLAIWQEQKYRELQGSYPVISLSFAGVKETTYDMAVYRMCGIIQDLYIKHRMLLDSAVLMDSEKKIFKKLAEKMTVQDAPIALNRMSDYLNRYYSRKIIILLDEYDTPMQEAYANGFWDEMAVFTRSLFNATFKTNPYLERGIMTGITRVGRESIFSDLNNLKVVTTTSEEYADIFGFTEKEVFLAMDEQGMTQKDEVKRWYDGFTFGNQKDIYNPWSILNYLDTGKFGTHWANTSSNNLISKLLREGNSDVKTIMEDLLLGRTFHTVIDEQIVFNQLEYRTSALWSLLLASGYFKD